MSSGGEPRGTKRKRTGQRDEHSTHPGWASSPSTGPRRSAGQRVSRTSPEDRPICEAQGHESRDARRDATDGAPHGATQGANHGASRGATRGATRGAPFGARSVAMNGATRQTSSGLPIAANREEIVSKLSGAPVLVLSGETGSGKTTQIPQYLLEAPWHKKGLRIGVTQPRRVAAMTLARRVASELGSSLGKAGAGAKVGYSVRFDTNVGHQNEIVFVTEGMLLIELLSDPGLCNYEVVVVDEVHERGINVDLLLGLMRNLVCGKGPGAEARQRKRLARLKVVIMSATADVESLKRFFEEGFPASTSPQVSTVAVAGRQHPVEAIYLPQPAQDVTEAALVSIFQVHRTEPLPGDILVFLTGREMITQLQDNIKKYASGLGPDIPKVLVLPLYAALSQSAQQLVFEPAPRFTRKIILATNIAESSITVPGVRYVIDTGKEKRKQFRQKLHLESLLSKPISKSSAKQRMGRAGREAPGKCWRLYTKLAYERLEQNTKPEIVRCDLADAILKMKTSGIDDIGDFPLLDWPTLEGYQQALLKLWDMQAVDRDGKVTDIGRHLSRFPLTPAYGRVLLEATTQEQDCLLPVIDIVASLSVEDTIFLVTDSEEARNEAASVRAPLLRRQGDHHTYLAVVQTYAAENADRKGWCSARKVNHRAMQKVMDIRKQLRSQCSKLKFISQDQINEYDSSSGGEWISDVGTARIMRCFMQGFKENIAILGPEGTYLTLRGKHTVAIHPSSILFGKKVEAILYDEFVFTTKPYGRGVSALQGDWIAEMQDQREAANAAARSGANGS
ncbi:hypothetical protein ANO11243_012720 [Dothideomycetidae sp. 11243]|nr:hypothetical protein ANO11243_012720 [fungal sp. No.11243]